MTVEALRFGVLVFLRFGDRAIHTLGSRSRSCTSAVSVLVLRRKNGRELARLLLRTDAQRHSTCNVVRDSNDGSSSA